MNYHKLATDIKQERLRLDSAVQYCRLKGLTEIADYMAFLDPGLGRPLDPSETENTEKP